MISALPELHSEPDCQKLGRKVQWTTDQQPHIVPSHGGAFPTMMEPSGRFLLTSSWGHPGKPCQCDFLQTLHQKQLLLRAHRRSESLPIEGRKVCPVRIRKPEQIEKDTWQPELQRVCLQSASVTVHMRYEGAGQPGCMLLPSWPSAAPQLTLGSLWSRMWVTLKASIASRAQAWRRVEDILQRLKLPQRGAH